MNTGCLMKNGYHKILRSFKRSMKIYTKTGDKGTSATYTGERRPKDDQIFNALGATDELSSHIGLAREHCSSRCADLTERLKIIQCILQDVGSSIATPKSSAKDRHLKKTEFKKEPVENLEKWIDEYMETVPPLKSFILPSGGLASCHLHIARSVCRRAEREIVPLVANGEMETEPAVFVNRLSDFLFAAARYCSYKDGVPEAIYKRTTGEIDHRLTRSSTSSKEN
ncbi:hypothetical protein HELRODRAFT_109895 [Helobdella robusta]|uniref:Corrinoid adenosyltransferase MMAB n=1 Tax=Helobdella robusta TaxID=6412 RepID=T1EEX2_HELRO|nr:hypothetical protein HELRODRAFT_109895 [Helobdella robusta]ESO08846.1 hypothetical protein HELRODRAFT_109895 [Helobdella robusta]